MTICYQDGKGDEDLHTLVKQLFRSDEVMSSNPKTMNELNIYYRKRPDESKNQDGKLISRMITKTHGFTRQYNKC